MFINYKEIHQEKKVASRITLEGLSHDLTKIYKGILNFERIQNWGQ